ncbi:hypothetical protein [Paludibaculum fermentans]|uniref:SprT-like domain-containing protein n=1 Tax=Paludibaculum fermentans TaxID=1473598 RepID=A0A7S7NLD3_PALFE|nr:hypothetical protein [Paludibaculum fermentans]QOY85723.1 hypothetical protein IRI77_23225 [Paludibaculum fermentans]
MRAYRGRLHSGEGPGEQVHAASFLRKRELVLDTSLKHDSIELARILTHEIFHFVWWRLGNRTRLEWQALIEEEFARGAMGELGWSAEARKKCLSVEDRHDRTRIWRDYICESFCDTAAWIYSGVSEHEEFTLKPRFRTIRRDWFDQLTRHHGGALRI